jgi:hypothetical protein
VLAAEYPGYGGSTPGPDDDDDDDDAAAGTAGSSWAATSSRSRSGRSREPSPAGLVASAEAVLQRARQLGYPPRQCVLYGQSIG